MFRQFCASALLLVSLAACGGGGSTSAYGGIPTGGPTAPPATAPLTTASINGSAGFVNTSQRTVYVFDADLATPNASTCTGACTGAWPPVTVAPGTSLPAPWTSFQRTDGTTQLAYNGRALYTFSGDSAPGQFNGDGLNEFGGIWHVARP
jgi:predicted lipoprotein with Yx(FWY)xxD motif